MCHVRSWIFAIAYRSSSYVIADFGFTGLDAPDGRSNDADSLSPIPPSHVILAFVILSLCFVHLITVVAWLNSLSLCNDRCPLLPIANVPVDPPLPLAESSSPPEPPTPHASVEDNANTEDGSVNQETDSTDTPGPLSVSADISEQPQAGTRPFSIDAAATQILRQRSKETGDGSEASTSNNIEATSIQVRWRLPPCVQQTLAFY